MGERWQNEGRAVGSVHQVRGSGAARDEVRPDAAVITFTRTHRPPMARQHHEPGSNVYVFHDGAWLPGVVVRGPEISFPLGPVYLIRFSGAFQIWVLPGRIRRLAPTGRGST